MRSNPDFERAAGAKTKRPAAMPRWVKVFGVVAAIAVAAFAVQHLAGGGMGHLPHGNDAHAMPAQHDQHVP